MDGAGKPMEPADGSPLSSLLRGGSQKVVARASDSLVSVEPSRVVHPLFSKCVEYRRLFPSPRRHPMPIPATPNLPDPGEEGRVLTETQLSNSGNVEV